MLKGISMDIYGNTGLQTFTTSENVMGGNFLPQDTTKQLQNLPSQPKLNLSKPSLSLPSETRSTKNIDSILAKSEQRERAIAKPKKVVAPQPETAVNPKDTSSVNLTLINLPYNYQKTALDELFANNFLLSIPHKTYSKFADTVTVNLPQAPALAKQTINQAKTIVQPKPINGFEGRLRTESSYNWIVAPLLISLFVFSWMRILYQKYIVQVVVALVNYQVSQRLLREKNVLFRNMAVGLNLVFSVNLGLFLYFVIDHFNFPQVFPDSYFLSILFYCTAVAFMYAAKTAVCKLLGYLFVVQDEFAEYTHNFNLFNKNIGLFLFPVVIMLPYVYTPVKPVLLYTGLLIFLALFILRTIRGFQIIIRKGVSTFYLILYLCAVEILPVLILVKYLSTLI